jgi:iron complex outermembrane receptor protein
VNLVSRTPRAGPPSLEAEIRGGSFGTGELHLSGTGSAGPVSALVALHALGTTGGFPYRPPDAPADVARQNNDARQLAGLVRLAAPLGPGRTLDVLAELEHDDRGLAGTIQSPSNVARLDESRLTAHARLAQAIAAGAVELRGFVREETFAEKLGPAPAIPEQDLLAGAEGRVRWRAGHHGLTALVRAAGEGFSETGQPGHTRPDLAVAAADEWLLAEGALSLLPAVRLDRVDGFTGISPQLALLYRPLDGLELRGSLGQAFRAPTFDELYVNNGFLAANPALRPERALAADLGATWEAGPLRVSAGGFASEYVDLIEYELYPPFLAKPFNVGTAGLAGVEGELTLRPRRELELGLVYARQWSRDLYDDVRFYGHELPYRPHHRGGARAAWTGDRVTGHAEAFAQSSQYLSRTNTAELSGRVDLSLGAAVRPLANQPLWFGLELQNALDQRGSDLYGYPLPGRALYALVRLSAQNPEHP